MNAHNLNLTEQYHGTYIRKVQYLSILVKNVQLHIKTHGYDHINKNVIQLLVQRVFIDF